MFGYLGKPRLARCLVEFHLLTHPPPMKSRSAIKIDLFADQCRRKKIESLGEPRAEIKLHIDFAAQAGEVDRIARRPVSRQGGRPPYPTKTMMGIPVFKRTYNPPEEQMEPTPLDCVN